MRSRLIGGFFLYTKTKRRCQIVAANILKVGNDPNSAIETFCVDTIEEIAKLPTMEHGATSDFANVPGLESPAPMGSQAIVGNESGTVKIYMLFSFGWKDTGTE